MLSKGNGQKSKMDGDEPGCILLVGLVSITYTMKLSPVHVIFSPHFSCSSVLPLLFSDDVCGYVQGYFSLIHTIQLYMVMGVNSKILRNFQKLKTLFRMQETLVAIFGQLYCGWSSWMSAITKNHKKAPKGKAIKGETQF